MDHVLLMTWHAFLVAVFFAFLWREDARSRKRLFLKTFGIMMGIGLVLGWLMYPFP
jgi:hypothetical protein